MSLVTGGMHPALRLRVTGLSGLQHAHFSLWEGNLDVLVSKGLYDRMVEFGFCRHIIGEGHPRFEGNGDSGISQLVDADNRCGFLCDAGMSVDHPFNCREGLRKVARICDSHGQMELTKFSIIV